MTPAATEVKEELSSSDEEVPVTPVVTHQKAKRTANKKCSRTPSTHLSRARKVGKHGLYFSSDCGTRRACAVMVRTIRTLCFECFYKSLKYRLSSVEQPLMCLSR